MFEINDTVYVYSKWRSVDAETNNAFSPEPNAGVRLLAVNISPGKYCRKACQQQEQKRGNPCTLRLLLELVHVEQTGLLVLLLLLLLLSVNIYMFIYLAKWSGSHVLHVYVCACVRKLETSSGAWFEVFIDVCVIRNEVSRAINARCVCWRPSPRYWPRPDAKLTVASWGGEYDGFE